MNSKKIIFATVVIFLVIVMTFAACKKGTEPIVVTDENGNPVTDINGEVITVIPETEIIEVTDENGEVVTKANGEPETTIRYIPQDVGIPVTDINGEAVTNADGEVLTTMIVVPVESTTGIIINVPVTDEKGETQTDENGSVVTETTISSLPDDAPSNNIAISNTIGGSGNDKFTSVAATSDGGFVAAMQTTSRDGGMAVTSSYKSTASVLVKFSKTGRQEWIKAVGGTGNTNINDIVIDKKGNIYVVGNAKKNEFFTIHGSEYDAFLQKYTSSGDLVFTKGWGGNSNEVFYGVAVDDDGNVYAAGFAYSQNGDCESLKIPRADSVAAVVKFDSDGNVVAQKGFGAFGDYFSDIDVNSNGEIFLSTIISSKKDTSLFTPYGYADVAMLKLDKEFKVLFSKQWGGSRADYIARIVATDDGGCVAVGNTKSSDYSFASLGNKGENDAIITKFNSDGSIGWIKGFVGTGNDQFTSVALASDGSIVVAGHSSSDTRDFKFVGNLGGTDAFVAKYSAGGSLISAQGFGGSGDDEFSAVCVLSSGQTLAAGSTLSIDGYFANLNPKSDGTNKMGMFFSFR